MGKKPSVVKHLKKDIQEAKVGIKRDKVLIKAYDKNTLKKK